MLIGTAGHVDHGKSALVEALTGVNPMHLPEELRRELTIELGFGHLRHPDGYTVGIVDVPGHEKLVRTMIAGASGFQIALWVVDAREGPMPQSLEHLDVLRLLGVSRIIPVLTKADLATEDEVRTTLKAVRNLVDIPAEVVDSRSGRGIPALTDRIFAACREFNEDDAKAEDPPYLPIDRCFVLKGVGVVVTGTLVRGVLTEGDSVAISSRAESYRIRSLHHHNQAAARVGPGNRVGVHLHGLKADDVHRGDVLTTPEYPYRSRRLNARLEFLPNAPLDWKAGLRAHFLAASFEMECRIWGLIRSSAATWAQIQLPREACFHRDQRFILRSTNPLMTIGGGVIADIDPDRPRRVTEAEQDRDRYFEIHNHRVFDMARLARKWLIPSEELHASETATHEGLIWHRAMDARANAMLEQWAAGAKGEAAEWPFAGVASELKIQPEYVRRYLSTLPGAQPGASWTLTMSSLRYDPRRGNLSESERRLGEELLVKIRAAGLQPLRLADYATGSPAERRTFDKVAGRLVREGRLMRIDNEFALDSAAWNALTAQVQQAVEESFTASEFGKRFGLSRKYSVPYLESLNRAGVLRRAGDRHMVIRKRR